MMAGTIRKRNQGEDNPALNTAPTTDSTSETSRERQCVSNPESATAASDPTIKREPKAKSEGTSSMVTQLSNNGIVTLDDMYDLTLVVGEKERPGGMKAFRVNSVSLRMASPPFKAMLSGRYAESKQSEIPFPDDSPNAFHTVLRVVHLKLHELPESMSKDELLELAAFCDKYLLADLVAPFFTMKNWLGPHKGTGQYLPSNADMQDWAFVAYVFRFKEDYDYLVGELVMCTAVDPDTIDFYYMSDGKKIMLHKDLPVAILGKPRFRWVLPGQCTLGNFVVQIY